MAKTNKKTTPPKPNTAASDRLTPEELQAFRQRTKKAGEEMRRELARLRKLDAENKKRPHSPES